MCKEFTMVRGDTFAFDLELPELDPSTIASIHFTVKKNIKDEDYILQKSIGDGITKKSDRVYFVRVAPEDTKNIEPGMYACDIQIGVNDDIYTPLIGSLRVVRDVTTKWG